MTMRKKLGGADRTAMAVRIAAAYNTGTMPTELGVLLCLGTTTVTKILREIRRGEHGDIELKASRYVR